MPFIFKAAAPLVALACLAMPADARPVSYPGGWTVMQMNNGDRSAAHLHYSPTFQDSIGIYSERNWDSDVHYTGLQYNRLVKRWNGDKSQANLYAKVSGGVADPFGSADSRLAGFVGVSADWETRRWFTSAETRVWDLGFDQTVHHTGRIGVAPYVGDFGDLHTWIMLEVANHPDGDEPITTTPLLRFFYGVQLLELGYTPQTDEVLLNWIVRF